MTETLFEGSFARFYSFYMERPWLSRPIARAVCASGAFAYFEASA